MDHTLHRAFSPPSQTQSKEPRKKSVITPKNSHNPSIKSIAAIAGYSIYSIYSIYSTPRTPLYDSTLTIGAQFFFGEADFFFAKRLFLREARDVSGAQRVPPWARVEIKLKMSFQALSHSPSHERASALTSPPPDFLFSSIPLKQPQTHPTQPHQIK